MTSSRRDETTHKLKDSSHAGFFTTQCRGLMPRTTVAEFRDPDRYTPDETSPTDPDRYTPDETSARVPDLPLLVQVPSSRRDETTHKLKDSSHAGFFTTQCRGLMPRTTVAEFRDPDRYTPDETSPTDPDRYTPDETSARVPDLPLLVQVPSSRRDETTHVLSTISLTAISRKWLPAWVDVQ